MAKIDKQTTSAIVAEFGGKAELLVQILATIVRSLRLDTGGHDSAAGRRAEPVTCGRTRCS